MSGIEVCRFCNTVKALGSLGKDGQCLDLANCEIRTLEHENDTFRAALRGCVEALKDRLGETGRCEECIEFDNHTGCLHCRKTVAAIAQAEGALLIGQLGSDK